MLYFICYTIYSNVLCFIGHKDGLSNWVDLARSSFGVLSVYFFPKSSVVTIQLKHFTLVEWCLNWFSYTWCVLCVNPYILMFYVLCIIGLIEGLSNWIDLPKSSFDVLSVYSFPKLSVVTIQSEHLTLLKWCLVVFAIFITFYMLYVIF